MSKKDSEMMVISETKHELSNQNVTWVNKVKKSQALLTLSRKLSLTKTQNSQYLGKRDFILVYNNILAGASHFYLKQAFTCLESTTETQENGAKYVQS